MRRPLRVASEGCLVAFRSPASGALWMPYLLVHVFNPSLIYAAVEHLQYECIAHNVLEIGPDTGGTSTRQILDAIEWTVGVGLQTLRIDRNGSSRRIWDFIFYSLHSSHDTAMNQCSIIEEYNVTPENLHTFTTYRAFRHFLFRMSKGDAQYVAVKRVTSAVLEKIEENRHKLPRMRLDHDVKNEGLIIKFVGEPHDIAAVEFTAGFWESCQSIGITRFDFFAVGSGRKKSADKERAKEPDQSFRPKNTRPKAKDMPTLCIEVGYSESLNRLRCDAQFWLSRTDKEVKVVILIHIESNTVLHVEHWEMILRRLARDPDDSVPTKLEEFDLCHEVDGTVVVSPPSATLDISTEQLYDTVPNHVTSPTVTISTDTLLVFAREYFKTL